MNFETSVKKYLVDLTVNSQEQEPMVIYGLFRLLTGLWILTTGFWDDNGVWDDAANWID